MSEDKKIYKFKFYRENVEWAFNEYLDPFCTTEEIITRLELHRYNFGDQLRELLLCECDYEVSGESSYRYPDTYLEYADNVLKEKETYGMYFFTNIHCGMKFRQDEWNRTNIELMNRPHIDITYKPRGEFDATKPSGQLIVMHGELNYVKKDSYTDELKLTINKVTSEIACKCGEIIST